MSYLIISFSHKNTDIQTREKLVFPSENSKGEFLGQIMNDKTINEAILLSTCNRIEIITSAKNTNIASKSIIKMISNYSGLEYDNLYDRADIYDNESAIHHLFSVASALDSLIIGETQIMGQLKDAFRFSLGKKYCAEHLTRALHYSFKCAAMVRNGTNLGAGSTSVAGTAAARIKEIIPNTKGVKALVIGTGQMSELAIKHLQSSGFDVVLTSRDSKKAQILADTFEEHIKVEEYSELNQLLNEIPVMITATSALYPIIKANMVKECKIERYWFDIAVPRDIDNIDIPNLMIYYVDDLQEIVNKNMTTRIKQAKTAYLIVNKMSLEFFEWLKSLEIEPIIKHMYLKGDDVINKKLKNAIKKGFVNSCDEKNIKKLCKTILSEYLYDSSKRLKIISKDNQCDLVVATVKSIFGFNHNTNFLNRCDQIGKIKEQDTII